MDKHREQDRSRTPKFWEMVGKSLERMGIDLEALEAGGEGVKCVVVAADLRGRIDELSRSPRDQVVMVRLDSATSARLDAWVETGTVKSRSEAAALFIREGMKVYQAELSKLESALKDVDAAKQRLAERVREVIGEQSTSDSKE